MLSEYADSGLTAEEFVDSIAIRNDLKIPMWHTLGSYWNLTGKILGYRITKELIVPREYRATLIRFLLTLEKDVHGNLTANREKVLGLRKDIQEMYSQAIPFYPALDLETIWKRKYLTELALFGWDDKMNNNIHLRDKVIHTSSREILNQWKEDNFNCKQLIYYTTDSAEYLKLVIEQSNNGLNYKLVEGLIPEKVAVIKRSKNTEHLKYHVNRWTHVCDYDWGDIIEQRERKLQAAISKEE